MEKQKPDLELKGKPATPRWHAATDIEKDVLAGCYGILPIGMRATDAKLEEFYDKGHALYKAGRYKEALPFFSLLTVAHVKEPRYVMAKGATLHMMKEYYSAGQCYNICSILDPDNPIPQYHLADCCLHMNNQIGAYIALQMALTRCKKNARHKTLQDRVEVMIRRLEKEFDEKKKLGEPFFVDDGTHHLPKQETSA